MPFLIDTVVGTAINGFASIGAGVIVAFFVCVAYIAYAIYNNHSHDDD